jgi:hypothetical protein
MLESHGVQAEKHRSVDQKVWSLDGVQYWTWLFRIALISILTSLTRALCNGGCARSELKSMLIQRARLLGLAFRVMVHTEQMQECWT